MKEVIMNILENSVKTEHKKVQKRARSMNIDMKKLDFLDEIPHQLDGPRIPELYDFAGKPSPYTKGPIKRVL